MAETVHSGCSPELWEEQLIDWEEMSCCLQSALGAQ